MALLDAVLLLIVILMIGVKSRDYKFYKINTNNFEELFVFKEKFQLELLSLQKKLLKMDQYYYPVFKIIDNYFWHEGYQLKK